MKNPKAGKTPWHQDYFYWPIDSANTVTVWIPRLEMQLFITEGLYIVLTVTEVLQEEKL